MVGPVALLAVFAIFVGFFSNPTVDVGSIDKHSFAHFVTVENQAVFPVNEAGEHEAAEHAGAAPKFNFVVAGVPPALALAYRLTIA